MGIKANFNVADINETFKAMLVEIDDAILKTLRYVGEKAVTHAKTIPPDIGFKDHSGCLRSSIGYVIFKDGKPIEELFEQVKEGKEGIEAGRKLALEIGQKIKEPLALVVVAGMNYAVHVESKGRDVLTSGEIVAKEAFTEDQAEHIREVRAAIQALFKRFGVKV